MTYSTSEVVELSGASYRQVDYWTRIGLIGPSVRATAGSGFPRLWSWRDVQFVAAVVHLRSLGWQIGTTLAAPLRSHIDRHGLAGRFPVGPALTFDLAALATITGLAHVPEGEETG